MRTSISERSGRILLEIGDEHQAAADVTTDGLVAEVHFRTASGHVDPQIRASVVAAVFELPALRDARALHASVPIGDAEMLSQLARRCPRLRARAAGATCLVDADL